MYTIVNDLGTFREGDFLNVEQAKWAKELVLEFCLKLKDEVIGIIDAIAPPDFIIGAPFGQSDGDIYKRYLTHVYNGNKCFERRDWW